MERKFKLTETQYNFLRENYAKEKKYKRQNLLFKLDLAKVPVGELEKQYKDLRFSAGIVDGFGTTVGKIAEGAAYSDAKKTADADKTIEDLKLKFDFNNQWQVQKVVANNQVSIIVAVGFIGENENLLIEAMNNAGYFNSFRIENDIRGMKWLKLQFEPMYEEDKTDDIRKSGAAWHWSPSYNEEAILQNGFIPKTENTLFSFPPRIYFMKAGIPIAEVINIGKILYLQNKDKRNNGEYTLFFIDTLDLPEECKFYYDPNLKNAMYTDATIPPDVIIRHKKFDFSKYCYF